MEKSHRGRLIRFLLVQFYWTVKQLTKRSGLFSTCNKSILLLMCEQQSRHSRLAATTDELECSRTRKDSIHPSSAYPIWSDRMGKFAAPDFAFPGHAG